MKITKQEMVLNEIIRSITSGEKKAGDYILTRDYNIMPKQMGILFKMLDENDIAKRTKANGYILTENCVENAQKLYLNKLSEIIDLIAELVKCSSIPSQTVEKMLKDKLSESEVEDE